jgi:DNA polymerase-3 subunit beta
MKIHCHRPSLAAAFQVVSGVIPTRTPKDILKNVMLQVADGKAVLIGTDQEIGIRYEIPGVEIESPGEMLLPTSRIISILRELQDDGVNLEIDDSSVLIRAGHSEFRLSLEDPSEFPPVTAFDEQEFYVVSGPVLREAIHRTAFATDIESTRYALGGILLELSGESLTLAATDSRRLAVVKSSCRSQGEKSSENVSPVIPSKAMTLIEKSIPEDEEQEVWISVHTNDVVVKSGPATISSRLVEGRFPRYQDVIPRESKFSLDIPVGPFYSAVRQAQIVTNEESRGVEFKFANGLLTLDSQAAEIGQSKVEMPVDYDGDELTITFDPRFVAEFLRILGPEKQVKLALIDSESAAVFKTDDAYTYVIMPLSRDR